MEHLKSHPIPIGQWSVRLAALSESLSGEQARIWVDAEGLGHRLVAGPLPLVGVSYIEKGSEAAAIEVTLGEQDDPLAHFTHMIDRPARVYMQETEAGDPRCLWIESEGAERSETLVCFDMSLEPAPGVRRLKVAAGARSASRR